MHFQSLRAQVSEIMVLKHHFDVKEIKEGLQSFYSGYGVGK